MENIKIKKTYRNFILIGLFAVAMGFLEAVVVVYLRELYYPRGFDFPLQTISPGILSLELIREGFLGKLHTLAEDPRFQQIMSQYKPGNFALLIFILGEILILFSIVRMVIRTKKQQMLK